jgi:translocation and assembly module TamB
LRLKAEQLAVGTLLIESMQGQQRQKDAELRALTGQFAWDGQRYMVNASADSDYGKASARLSLNGVAPFDLSGVASLESHPHPEVPPVTLDLQLVGNLRSFHASLDARPLFKENPLQAALTGHAELDVFPFSQPALGPATIAFQHFNPAAWHASLPEADLDLRADVLLQQSPRQERAMKHLYVPVSVSATF